MREDFTPDGYQALLNKLSKKKKKKIKRQTEIGLERGWT